MAHQAESLWLTHPKECRHGQGRIVYAERWLALGPGWVLPGGMRTADEDVARHAARWIDLNAARSRDGLPATA